MKSYFFSEPSWLLRQNALQLTTLESLPEQGLRWWPTMSNHGWNIFLCIHLSATHSSFVYVNLHPVSVPSFLGFPFSCWLSLAYMHLTECLTLCPKAYIPLHSCHPQPYIKNVVLMSVLLYSKQTMIIHDAPKRLPEHAASLQQQTEESWEQWSSWAKWMPYVLPHLGLLLFTIGTLPSLNTFSLCFPEAPGFCVQ
jgi:hypothetical protein